MHCWGDAFFQQYGDDLYNAIAEIERRIRKAHIGICGKEKYGCYRDDFLTLWDGGLYQILFGYRARIESLHNYKWNWLNKFVDIIHSFVFSKIDNGWYNCKQKENETLEEWSQRINKRWWKGLIRLNYKIGLTGLVRRYQEKQINKAFQIVCKKYPHLVDELICDVDCYNLIKPCKWGDIDGEAIHKKYWKPLKEE